MPNIGDGPLTAPIAVTLTGSTAIVPILVGSPVVLLQLSLTADADTTITFKDSSGTAITGAFTIVANGSITLPYTGKEWFRTALGKGLNLSQTGTANIGGIVVYLRG